MKNFSVLLLALFLSISSAMLLTACSDDSDGGEQLPPKNPIEIPEELAQKLHTIYAQSSIEPQTVTSVHQLAILTSVCASRDGYGPISVTPCRLNGEEITLVTLGGTQQVEGQATTMKENQLASFGKPNDYLTAVTKLFQNGTIPASKPVLVTGISLGGMIAQQILGVGEVLESHTLKGIITFGSPITLPLNRHDVKVVRFADVNDKVPQLGEMLLRGGMVLDGQLTKDEQLKKMAALDVEEKIARQSKYTDMIETHALSYIEDACWQDVDFWGDPAKKNTLELTSKMIFYPAPKLTE